MIKKNIGRSKFYFAILTLIMIFSCDTKDDPKTLEETEIAYNIIEQGNFSSSQDDGISEQYLVFETKTEWSDYLQETISRFNQDQSEKFDQLNFNFDKNTLIIITSGYDNSCCKTIEINKVYVDQGRIYVTFNVSDTDATEQVLSQSYILFEVTK